MELIKCENVVKTYGKKEALKGVNLSLTGGKIVGLLGPNGSGKTTILKIFNGLLRTDRGEVLIDGKMIGKETKAICAFLPDHEFLPEYMTIQSLVKYYADFFADFDRERAEKMLSDMEFDMTQKIKSCSKGMKEKIRLVLTISRRAKVYLLDEPIAGVDPAAREYILKTVVENYAPDSLLLFSTHLIADVEPFLDEVIFLNQGKITLHENAEELRERTGKSVDELFREEFRC